MTTLTVWAPTPATVEVVLDPAGAAERIECTRDERGVWTATREVAADGAAYGFSLDGADPLPDPRSPRQPEGVHGPSMTVDTSAFVWTDDAWRGPRDGRGALGGVIYEMHVGTFTPEGTFAAAERHLDALVELGVDVVEVMPVAAFPGRWGWGYDGVDLYAVHEPYGGPAAFAHFVDACHARGLGVCLDVVYNHLGPSGNYLGAYAPYFTDTHVTPWGPAVNLDADGSEHVRRFIIDNVLRWLRDFHVDALRLDAVHELRDDSERHVLAQIADETAALSRELGRPLDLIAESDLNDAIMVTPTAEGGRGMSAQWNDDLHHALHVALTGEKAGYYEDFAEVGALARTLRQVFFHNGRFSSFRGRDWGAAVDPERVDGRRFVGYLQTHDQVGNRAVGDRVTEALTPGQQAAGAAIYLTCAHTSMIFMGEEWRASTPWQFFTDHEDEDLAEAVRTGRRSEFAMHGWDEKDVPDPQDPLTRERSVLLWDERTQGEHGRMLAWYRDVIALVRDTPDLLDGRLQDQHVEASEDDGWLTLQRGRVIVACNLATAPAEVSVPAGYAVRLCFSGRAHVLPTSAEGAPDRVGLDGHDVAILLRD